MRKMVVILGLAGVCGFFMILQMILLSKVRYRGTAVVPRDKDSTARRHAQWIRLLTKRRDKTTWGNTKDGAFIHMGKTGGSSLSLLLRNGCHSFMPKPCRTVPLETIVSRMVGTYYHVPDFGLIPQGKHSFYIISLRDPLKRSISAFVYEHIDNVKARGETMSPLAEEAKTEAKKCFPTLEKFVEDLGDNPQDYDYPYHRSQIVADNCTNLARAVVDGKVRRFNHFFFPFQKIRSFIAESNSNPLIFATRQEHLWYDWKKINYLLGQVGDVITPLDNENARDLSQVHQPVSRELSDIGRQRFCKVRSRTKEFKLWTWGSSSKLQYTPDQAQLASRQPTLFSDTPPLQGRTHLPRMPVDGTEASDKNWDTPLLSIWILLALLLLRLVRSP